MEDGRLLWAHLFNTHEIRGLCRIANNNNFLKKLWIQVENCRKSWKAKQRDYYNQLLLGAELLQFKLIQNQEPNWSNYMYSFWLALRADFLRENVENILVVGEAEVSPYNQNPRKNSLIWDKMLHFLVNNTVKKPKEWRNYIDRSAGTGDLFSGLLTRPVFLAAGVSFSPFFLRRL